MRTTALKYSPNCIIPVYKIFQLLRKAHPPSDTPMCTQTHNWCWKATKSSPKMSKTDLRPCWGIVILYHHNLATLICRTNLNCLSINKHNQVKHVKHECKTIFYAWARTLFKSIVVNTYWYWYWLEQPCTNLMKYMHSLGVGLSVFLTYICAQINVINISILIVAHPKQIM